MAETVFAGKQVKKFRTNKVLPSLLRLTQYSLGSRNTSSCVTVQAIQAMGIANEKSQRIWVKTVINDI